MPSSFASLPWERIIPYLDPRSLFALTTSSASFTTPDRWPWDRSKPLWFLRGAAKLYARQVLGSELSLVPGACVLDRLLKLAKRPTKYTVVQEISDVYLHHGSRSVLNNFLKARKNLEKFRVHSPPRSPEPDLGPKRKVAFAYSPVLAHARPLQTPPPAPAPVIDSVAKRKTLKVATAAEAKHTKNLLSGKTAESPIRQMRLEDPLPVAELRAMENPATAVVQAIKFRGGGSLRRAWLFLDMNNNGKLSADELQYGLQLLRIDWDQVTSFPAFGELFTYFQDLLHEHTFSTTKILPITYDSLVFISSMTVKKRDMNDWNMLTTREQWAAYSAATAQQPTDRKREPSWHRNNKKVLPRLVENAAKAIATHDEIKKQGATHPSMRAFIRKKEKMIGAHFVAEMQEELRRITRRVQGLSEPRRELSKAKQQLHLIIDPAYDPRAERKKAELDRKRKAVEGGFFGSMFKSAVANLDTYLFLCFIFLLILEFQVNNEGKRA
jgi:hypothetical protein